MVSCIVFDFPSREYPHIHYIFRNYNHKPTLAADHIGLSSLKFSGALWNFFYFCTSDVSAVQGRPRSLNLAPIESTYATSVIVTLVLSCTISEILRLLWAPDPTHIPPLILGVFLLQLHVPDGPCWGQRAQPHKP